MVILTKRFLDAVEYAFYLHAGQKRKGTKIPYISHLMGVSSLVLEHGGTEDEAIAALLHDAVEDRDTPVRADENLDVETFVQGTATMPNQDIVF